MGAGKWWSRRERNPRNVDPPRERVDISLMAAYGNRWCGSTCLAVRFAYDLPELITCNFDHATRWITLDDEKIFLLIHKDYGGIITPANYVSIRQMIQLMLRSMLSRTDVAGVMFVFDVTKLSSWEATKEMVKDTMELRENYSHPPSRSQFMIVGCKCDLVESREVEYPTVKEFADEHGVLYMETSAKENFNVEYAFVSFAAHLLESSSVGRDGS